MLIPAMRAISGSPLTLLVTRVLADDEHRSVAADDLALLAHRLDRRSYLHDPFRLQNQRGRLCPPPSGLPLPVADARMLSRRTRRANTIAACIQSRTGPRRGAVGAAER